MSDLILRAATAADVPALAALGRDSFVDKFGYMYRPEDLAAFIAEVHSPATVTAEMADPERRYCLAEIDGALAGYCKLAIPSTLGEHHRADYVASSPVTIRPRSRRTRSPRRRRPSCAR